MLERCSLGMLDRGFSTGSVRRPLRRGNVRWIDAYAEGVLGTGSPARASGMLEKVVSLNKDLCREKCINTRSGG